MNLQNITLDPFTYLGVLFIILVLFIVVTIQSIKLYKRNVVIQIQEDSIDQSQRIMVSKNAVNIEIEASVDKLIQRNTTLSLALAEAIKTIKDGREKV